MIEKRKKNPRKIWFESLLILAGTIAATVQTEVEKKLIREEKSLKALKVLAKAWDNEIKQFMGPENLSDIGKNSLIKC